MSFLTISNKNVILKTQRIRLGATVEPHIGLEQVLITFFSFYILYEMCFANNFHSFITVIILNTFWFTSVLFETHNLSSRLSKPLQLPLYLSKLTANG